MAKTASINYILFPILFLLPSLCNAGLPTHLIYQDRRIGTWFENAAVRSNGDILLTCLNNPAGLQSVTPFHHNPELVLVSNEFDGLNSTLGIVETDIDTFWVIASNFSLDPITLGTQRGTNAIFKVNFDDCATSSASVSLLTYLAEAQFLNGLTKFNNTYLLAADSELGVVWGINTETSDSIIVARDHLMRPKPVDGFAGGINGLRFHGNTLYFTNAQRRLFGAVELDEYGYQKGSAALLSRPVMEQDIVPNWDDFAIDSAGEYAYIATDIGNTIQRIDLKNGNIEIFAGGLNDTSIAQPTSAVFGRTGRDAGVLYAMTAGGLAYPVYTSDGPKQYGAQVVAIDISEL